WQVSFTRRGRTSGKYFADSLWGGRRGALAAALAWRDDRLPRLYPPVRVRRWTPRNRTGEVGVMVERRRIEGRVHRAYAASWRPPGGGSPRRLFYVSKYGEDGAFERAVRARRSGVKAYVEHVRQIVAREVAARRRGRLSRMNMPGPR